MTVKMLAAGVAATAALGAAGAALAMPAGPAPVPVQPAVFGVPLPRDPAPAPPATDLPTAEQLTGILDNLADPARGYQDKNLLVEGGIPANVGHGLDHQLRKAARHGDLPLSFQADNIQSTGPDTASADVTVTGPRLAGPITKTLTFVNQNGWVLSHDSGAALLQEATAGAGD